MFQILPAIDLRGGRCVRLLRGDYAQETVYNDDPTVQAREFEALGAPRLHVVDLDGAREGRPVNHEAVALIARAISIPVQIGGGLRSRESIAQVLEAGVERAIIGTKAIQDEAWASEMFEEFGARLILGIDAREGRVATAGWLETSDVEAEEFARRAEGWGCRRIIFTDIARDGTLAGPNLEALEKVASAVGIPVVASGGVHVAEDAREIKKVANVEGVIVGRALYEKTASLPDLLAIAAEND
jgi:phosphoribosylformimino-5-aminoimidazole carboxamide ribotide isomerase